MTVSDLTAFSSRPLFKDVTAEMLATVLVEVRQLRAEVSRLYDLIGYDPLLDDEDESEQEDGEPTDDPDEE